MQTLKTGSSSKLYLCGYITDGTYELEQILHNKFKYAKINGEWFRANQPILDYINSNSDMMVEVENVDGKLYIYKKMKCV